MRSSLKKLEKSLVGPVTKRERCDYDAISKIHKYWSRKPWRIIQQYVSQYSKEGDTVLDNFCGSGAIGLECIAQGRNFIGYDLNPSAIFISENTLDPEFCPTSFDQDVDSLVSALKASIMDMYKVGKDEYLLYQIQGKNDKDYNSVVADYSFKKKSKKSLSCGDRYILPKGLLYPDMLFPKEFYKDRFSYKGVSKVSDLFSRRNLHALSMLYSYIAKVKSKNASLLWLAFSNTLLHVSKLKSENIRPLGVNNYWIPDDYIEENVIWRFLDRVQNIRKAKVAINERIGESRKRLEVKLHNKSSLPLKELKNSSIDYVITDPPYGDAIQYSELSYVWNCWLKQEYPITDEVIINPKQKKGAKEYQSQLAEFIASTYRVLKPGGFFTLCFHNKDLDIWLTAIALIKAAGFSLHETNVHSPLGNPYNKSWSKFSPKSDLYVTFKKERLVSLVKKRDILDVEGLVDSISDYIRASNEPLNLNRAYDLLVIAIIDEIFSGKEISAKSKITLKEIVQRFEAAAGENGSRPKRSNRSIQKELPL